MCLWIFPNKSVLGATNAFFVRLLSVIQMHSSRKKLCLYWIFPYLPTIQTTISYCCKNIICFRRNIRSPSLNGRTTVEYVTLSLAEILSVQVFYLYLCSSFLPFTLQECQDMRTSRYISVSNWIFKKMINWYYAILSGNTVDGTELSPPITTLFNLKQKHRLKKHQEIQLGNWWSHPYLSCCWNKLYKCFSRFFHGTT